MTPTRIQAAFPRVIAIVPVKPFVLAKQRLAPVLSRRERAALAAVMLQDVLAALAGCSALAGALVVTRDGEAAEIAQRHGAAVMQDHAADLNGALRDAAARLREEADGLIVVPGDIPLLPGALIAALVDHLSIPRRLALVPAERDGGTNLLAATPPDAVAPCFGPDSFRRHWLAGQDAGLAPVCIPSGEAGLDIDRLDDLETLLARSEASRTSAYLMSQGIADRIVDHRIGEPARTAPRAAQA